MSDADDSHVNTYFENRRTQINSMHQIDDERVSGRRPVASAAQQGRRVGHQQPETCFPPSPRQYAPEEWGLNNEEEFRHPRMFENLSYGTDAAAFETMRAQNARPRYQQQQRPHFSISDLPSEQLEDFSNPQFDDEADEDVCAQQHRTPNISQITEPDFCDISDASPWPERISPAPRQQFRQQQMQQQQRRQSSPSYPNECLDDESAPIYDSPPAATPTPSPPYHYTPIELRATPDVCTPTPRSPTPTPPPRYSPIRFQPSPVHYTSECLEDVSVPSYPCTPCDMPSPARFPTPQNLPSDMVCDVSPPSFRSPPTPSISYPSEMLDSRTMPSFDNASCGSPLDRRFLLDPRLADESPLSFVSSTVGTPSSRRRLSFSPSSSRRASSCPTPAPSASTRISPIAARRSATPSPQRYEPTPVRIPSASPRRFNLAQMMSQRTPSRSPCGRSPSPCTPTPPAPHVSLYPPTPVRRRSMPSNLPSECLTDVSEPAYFHSPPRGASPQMPSNLPSECLGDISAPSYAMTPPARTPSLPCDLPSEQICDMSQPMYESPRSEHLSSMSMPSYADTSCGSPLDRRFLLDRRLADESPPNFASTFASSGRHSSPRSRSPSPAPCPSRRASPCLARPPSPCPPTSSSPFTRSRSASPQRSLSPPCYAPSARLSQRSRSLSPVCPPVQHFSLRSPPRTPGIPKDLPNECLMDISEPAYFSSPPRASPERRTFPSRMTSECLADISAPSYEMTPPARTPSLPHNLPSDMICDMSPPIYQSPASERLSGESMPSYADTSCGSPLDRRFLLDPHLADESMPSMISSRATSTSPANTCPPSSREAPSFDATYCEILHRFNALKCKVNTPPATGSSSPGSPGSGGASAKPGECIRETVVERTENENGQLASTTQHVVVMMDPCGSIKTHTKEVKTEYPQKTQQQRLLPPSADSGVLTQSPRPPEQIENLRSSLRRRLSFNVSDMPSENLVDVSMPCDADGLPSMDAENMLQYLSSVPEDQLVNISAPLYRTPPTPSISYPSERLESMTMPSFENASCGSPLDRRFLFDPRLMDESPPSFASSYAASASSPSHACCASRNRSSPARQQSPVMRSRTPSPMLSRQYSAHTPPPRRFSLRTASRRTESPVPMTPAAPYISLHSPSPIGSPPRRAMPSNLPSEQIFDISEAAYFDTPPRASPQRISFPANMTSERLDDMTQPSFQRTPPPPTPGMPSSLPSEMLGNVSAPSYQSPASENISSVSIPSFEDVSYESPLDRRFLLDPRLADESMPSLPRTPSTSQRTPRRADRARRRLSYSQPVDSTRIEDEQDVGFRSNSEGGGSRGQRGPTTTTTTTHTTIEQSGTLEQERSVTPAERGQEEQHGGGRPSLIDIAKEQLKIATSIHSISHVRAEEQQPKGRSSGTRMRRRSMSLPSENLGDISMPSQPPSMGMSTTGGGRRSQHYRTTPWRSKRQQHSIQDVNDISPISFATVGSSTMTSSPGGRSDSGRKYRSTSSRGFSGLANYAPFIEQIRSHSNSPTCDSCDPCCTIMQQSDQQLECDPCGEVARNSSRVRRHGT